MYAAKERETLVIETAHILSFGLFLCPQAFEKVSVDIGCKSKLTQNSFMQTGLTMGKGADIFALVSRGHRGDRIPPRHFAASMDESVIVGYYTLKKCRSPALRCLQISKKGKIQWQEMMESTAP